MMEIQWGKIDTMLYRYCDANEQLSSGCDFVVSNKPNFIEAKHARR